MDDVFYRRPRLAVRQRWPYPLRRQQKYGLAAPVQGKIYAFWAPNAPMEAFTDKDQFFHGVGVDGVYLPFHKANQFLSMEALPTFIANDVIKCLMSHGIF